VGVGVGADAAAGGASDDPCVDDHVTAYLNRRDVQAALHVPPMGWAMCSDKVDYAADDVTASMLPNWRRILASNVAALVYSGDVDAVVPFTGTRKWIDELRLDTVGGGGGRWAALIAEVQAWRPWMGSDGQVAGYVTAYDGLTFATVRDAGHMVPWTQPARARDMFSRFLRGQEL
jgi:serine carboxypeptidase-like clade II